MLKKLSANIRELRKAANLTQQQLADKLNKAGSTVRMWELGKASPDNETLLALSRIFGVSTDYLLSNTEHVPEGADMPMQPLSAKDKEIAKLNKELVNLSHKQLKLVKDLVNEISRSNHR